MKTLIFFLLALTLNACSGLPVNDSASSEASMESLRADIAQFLETSDAKLEETLIINCALKKRLTPT